MPRPPKSENGPSSKSSNKERYDQQQLVRVGTVIGPYGLAGFVKVESYAESRDFFFSRKEILVQPVDGVPRACVLEEVRRHRGHFLLKFRDAATAEHAERLRGASLLVPRTDLEALDEGEYYWFELIGLEVFDEHGSTLGVVERLFRTKAHDVLVVRDQEQERFIPAVDRFVERVDIDNGRLIVRLPEQPDRQPNA